LALSIRGFELCCLVLADFLNLAEAALEPDLLDTG